MSTKFYWPRETKLEPSASSSSIIFVVLPSQSPLTRRDPMSLSFEEKLRNYARLGLIHGLGFDQRPRPLYIDSYQIEDHGHLIAVLAKEAYALGVETVDVRYRNPELERAMFLGAPETHKLYEPKWVSVRAQEIVDHDGARIALKGNGDLGVMDDVDPKYPSGFKSAYMKANEPYTSRRMKMLQPWTLVDVPTIAWAKKLGTSIEDLWEFLFTITGADRDDSLAQATVFNSSLSRRCDLLNTLGITTLHFVGEGTDLKVGLSSRARWLGGRKESEDGTWFEPNWPTFEVFTTPDWRKTEGVVRVTMPSVLDGPIVEGLRIWFSEGRVSKFTAQTGSEAFGSLISRDDGAAQLGEVACVGLESALSQYTEPHFCTLLDENKRCHIALGEAYASALKGGPAMSQEDLAEIGCNESGVHHDLMISDETTSIFAYDASGNKVAQLMNEGRWLAEFI
ncbi:MAG: hypothetical protein JWN89_46 [Parcubacteria group bacterium]|nr:hypothetical protein [Parcubacteria group bacterium]